MIRAITWCSVMVVLAAACTPPDDTSGHEADIAAITQATVQWAAAFERGDVEGALAGVTQGARFVPPNEPVVSGASAIGAWTRGLLSELTFEDVASTVDSVRVAGDWAVSRGSWAVTMSAEGAVVTDTSRYVVIWERQADGLWKVAYDIWNFAQPLPASEGPDGA